MQGKKNYQEKLFLSFQLSDHVPADNFYRRLKEVLDFSFLYQSTSEYYGAEGQKSIDPVVFMKLMLVGYFENITSDRKIVAISRLRLDILYFINYDLDEELPWHSTLSRTRQLYGNHIFTEMFKRVLKQCIDLGMISGRRQAIDGFYVKANASLSNLVERDILNDADVYSKELDTQEQVQEKEQELKLVHASVGQEEPVEVKSEKAQEKEQEKQELKLVHTSASQEEPAEVKPEKAPGNDTHYCPNDPDARLSVKRGKAMALNYLGQVSVDTATYMITHIQAFTADKRDSECLSAMLVRTKANLQENELQLQEIVADSGYSSANALKALEANRIEGYIPNRAQFNYEREGFSYNAEEDYYECTQGIKVKHTGTYLTAGYWMKNYYAKGKQCAECPLKDKCIGYKPKRKSILIKETAEKSYYDKMHLRMQTRKAKRLLKIRQSTVEPVIGTLVNYLGIKKVNVKGLDQANKCLTMAAIAYNLKKC